MDTFPNSIFVPGQRDTGRFFSLGLGSKHTFMSVLKDYPKEFKDQVTPPSTMHINGVLNYINFQICLSVPWRRKDDTEFPFSSCDPSHILMINFQHRRNFTVVFSGPRLRNFHADGMIQFAISFGKQGAPIEFGKFVFLGSRERGILYCDTGIDKNNRLIEWNIFRPFKTEVWVLKLVLIIIIILVYSSREITLGCISKNLHIVFGTLLTQEGAQRSGVPILLSFFVFFYYS